jgi:hypothetical protein
MEAIVSLSQDDRFEIISSALNTAVGEYLRSVHDRGGAAAFDNVAANLVTEVCALLTREFGPERLFELFDSIEAAQAKLSQLGQSTSSSEASWEFSQRSNATSK